MTIIAIKPYITKTLLTAIILTFLAFILVSNTFAQEEKKGRGYNGLISKELLIEYFKRGKVITGYIIKGDDVIEIIRDTDYGILIRDSIIIGGLDFTKLPIKSLDNVKLPEIWDDIARETFLKEKKSKHEIHVVTNEIWITNSEIQTNVVKRIQVLDLEAESVPQVSGIALDARSTFFYKRVSFQETTFNGIVLISTLLDTNIHSALSGGGDFTGAVFNDNAYFSKAIFSQQAIFVKATFSGKAEFISTTFTRGWIPPDFPEEKDSKASFEVANFKSTNFGKNAYFRGATFSGRVDFLGAIFNEVADFSGATFNGNLSRFSMTNFNGRTNFSKSNFCGTAFFLDTIFNKSVTFQGTNFFWVLGLSGASFEQYVDFRTTQIKWLNYKSNKMPTVVRGHMDFRNATITDAHFQDIIFENDINFSDVKFGIHINDKNKKDTCIFDINNKPLKELNALVFRYVIFESDAYFIRTEFTGDTALERVTFKKEVNFTDATFDGNKNDSKQKFSLSYLNFKTLLIKFTQLPKMESWVRTIENRIKSFLDENNKDIGPEAGERLEPLSQVLKGLKANFLKQGELSDANMAYYHMKDAELSEAKYGTDGWHRFVKRAEWILWGISCGYGTKILLILFWYVFFDFLFTISYFLMDNADINRKPHPDTEKDFIFKQRLRDFPKQYLTHSGPSDVKSTPLKKFIDALRLSSVILCKIGPRDTTISGRIFGIDCKHIVRIEWVMGWYLLVFFVLTMSRTLPFVNELITSVFQFK